MYINNVGKPGNIVMHDSDNNAYSFTTLEVNAGTPLDVFQGKISNRSTEFNQDMEENCVLFSKYLKVNLLQQLYVRMNTITFFSHH